MFRTLLLAFAFLALLAGPAPTLAMGMFGGDEEEKKEDDSGQGDGAPATDLAEASYLQLDPLAAPVISRNRVRYNVLLTLSLEIADQSAKAVVVKQVPRLRDAMLRDLFSVPIERDAETGKLDLVALKARMLDVSRRIVGGDQVRDVLVISALRMG